MFNIFKKQNKNLQILSPLKGEIFPLSVSPDEAFATGIMGEGVCIEPSEHMLYAPFECDIEIFHTLHAVGCRINDIEAIVHIGMNTVSLEGQGFKALVPLQGHVNAKTPLIEFDRAFLSSKVQTLITPVIVVEKPDNTQIKILKDSGIVEPGEPILEVIFN
ncbi:MAG: PTS sugar transporter subunit IIA [Brevinemataceae bacterium]